MEILALMSDLTSLGAAGVMGAMWLCERKMNRTRDEQLTQSHQRILRDEQRLEQLMEVVEQNSRIITHFTRMQHDLCDTIRHLMEEQRHDRNR